MIFTVLEGTKWKKWTPSPTGIGIGMLVPASGVATMFVGAIAGDIWTRVRPKQSETHQVPLASGFIAGEAIVAVIIPVPVTIAVVR